MSLKLHLDTDIGGDMDDLCALAMLLKWPDLDITGITTTAESNGRRAGYVDAVLKLAGRADIAVAAGADLADGGFRYAQLGYPLDTDNWPVPIPPHPNPLDDALDLLKRSIEQGARLVGIGPFTNFMLLDRKYPGILRQTHLYMMGGYIDDIPAGYPQFSPQDDWNMQLDVTAARYVLEYANVTLVPLTLTAQTALRRSDLPKLAQAGELGNLLVRQADTFARTEDLYGRYGATCPKLPADFINFHHDPLACAVALGWRDGLQIETLPLRFEEHETYLYARCAVGGRPTRVVTRANVQAFNAFWLNCLTV